MTHASLFFGIGGAVMLGQETATSTTGAISTIYYLQTAKYEKQNKTKKTNKTKQKKPQE